MNHRTSVMILASCTLVCVAGSPANARTMAEVQSASPDQLMESSDWSRYSRKLTEVVARIKSRAGSNDKVLQANIDQTSLMTVVQAALVLAQQDPRYPDWIPYYNKTIPIAAPNPDTIYYVARVSGDGIYRISGKRGTVRLVDIQIKKGLWGLVDSPGLTFENFDLDSFKIQNDRSFELILSAARPEGYQGNWARLDPFADHIMVRQVAYDWLREEDARLSIERLDVTTPQPRRSPDRVESALKSIPRFVERLMFFWQDSFKKMREGDLVNKLGFIDTPALKAALNTRQAYYQGIFDLKADEVLLLETEVPRSCRYWGIQLVDELINSIDYMYHQSSLNGGTAHIDGDGKLRVVIAREDPGVPNWLDTAQHDIGGILGRWYGCDSAPLPVLTKMTFADVRRRLPADTPVVSADERRALLTERIRGAQLRRRW